MIYFVLPCFNEEECLGTTSDCLNRKYDSLIKEKKISPDSKIVFVDDGSRDGTWDIIDNLSKKNERILGVKLAHNVGHQNALFAGLVYAGERSDATISMDADLQDDLSVIDGFLEKYNDGCEIVFGARDNRDTDSFFKRSTAQFFYKFMRALGVNLVYNSADCRLMSKRAVECLKEYTEVNLFLRGIVPLIGLKSDIVTYKRNARTAGKSKYPVKKMMGFACDGITSFSIKPIRLVFSFGMLTLFTSIAVMIYSLIVWAMGNTVSGWTFTICSIWLVAGIQMVSIGLIGEYIGKIYAETKRRPRYVIECTTSDNNKGSKNEG